MASYHFMDLSGLYIDVPNNNATPGAVNLQIWYQKPGDSPNQSWTFQEQGDGLFFIRSNLGPNLVVQANGAGPHSPLVLAQQSGSAAQLWAWEPVIVGGSPPWGFVQSAQNRNMVIDITGGATRAPQTPLELWPQNPPAQSGNQQWIVFPVEKSTFSPSITKITQAGQGASVVGAGFQAGYPIFGNYLFAGSASSGSSSGSFTASADLAGNFTTTFPIDELKNGVPGELFVNVWIPPMQQVHSEWSGSAFGPPF
jgi:hypothetical protein